MSSMGHVPVRFTEMDECPEPFREPLHRAISPSENIYEIIYSPAFVSGRSSMPGSVFCVTERAWIIVRQLKKRGLELTRALYSETLLIELTDILLYGQLKIVYAGNDQCRLGICFFNTVSEDMYTKAIYRVLNLIGNIAEPPGQKDRAILAYLESWPLEFRNCGWDFLPPDGDLLDGINWPTIFGWLRRHLGPGMALILTDRHLVTLADEPSRSWFIDDDHVNVGVIVTYIPRSRISGFETQKHKRFHILEIQVNNAHSHERVRLRFPPELQGKIIGLANKAMLDGRPYAGVTDRKSPAQPGLR
jgi:hypothetical protein